MNELIRLAIGSTCSKPGDIDGNLRQIEDFCRRARANECDLLLTPEMSATGYGSYPEILAHAEPAAKGKIYREISRMAAEYNLTVTAGFVEQAREKRYLAHYIIMPDGSYVIQRKHRVTPAEAPLDTPAELWYDLEKEDIGQLEAQKAKISCFECRGVKSALVICADMGLIGLNEELKQNGVKLLLIAVGAGGARSDRITGQELAQEGGVERRCRLGENGFSYPRTLVEESLRYQRASAVVNMGGYDGKRYYHGGSGSIVSPLGTVEAYLPGNENLDEAKPMFACGSVDLSRMLHR